jgi:hypothetical protein
MDLSIKKKFSSAFNKIDTVFGKTYESCSSMLKNFNDCYEIARAERYSNVKNLLISTKKNYADVPFLNKLLLSPNNADWISRYVGGTTALSAVKLTLKLGKYTVSVAGSLGVLSYLQPDLDMSNKLNAIMVSSGLIKFTPLTATAAVVMIGFTVYAARNLRKMYLDGQFDFSKNTLNHEIVRVAVKEGTKNSPKLESLLQVYRSQFKPDFLERATELMSEVVLNKGSESVFIAGLEKEQQDTINKLARKLSTAYFVPDHLLHNAALTLIVEAKGNAKAVMARLNSRIIDDDWVSRFQMDPLARAVSPKSRTDQALSM